MPRATRLLGKKSVRKSKRFSSLCCCHPGGKDGSQKVTDSQVFVLVAGGGGCLACPAASRLPGGKSSRESKCFWGGRYPPFGKQGCTGKYFDSQVFRRGASWDLGSTLASFSMRIVYVDSWSLASTKVHGFTIRFESGVLGFNGKGLWTFDPL